MLSKPEIAANIERIKREINGRAALLAATKTVPAETINFAADCGITLIGENRVNELLEKYGQGGNCGYDKNFRYDNSFLIMDRQEIYVLETAGREWAYKKYEHASISNRLTLGDDCDAYSGEPCDFAKEHSDFLYSTFSAAAKRRKMTCSSRLDSIYDAFTALRQHTVKDPMCRASVSSVCMHAGDMFADQTTSSMVVDLTDEIKSRHIERLRAGNCTIEMGFILTDLTTDFERVSDHCSNIAGLILEMSAHGDVGTHQYLRDVRAGGESFKRNYNEYMRKYSLGIGSSSGAVENDGPSV